MISRISIQRRRVVATGKELIAAFTLIELLLVVILISISMAAIIPRLSGSIPAWQVREDSKNILAAIRLARRAAIGEQEIMFLEFDAGNDSFLVEKISASAKADDREKNILIPRQFLGKTVKIAGLEGFELVGNRKGFIFLPNGRTKKGFIKLTANTGNDKGAWYIRIENDCSAVLEEVFGNE